MISHESEKFKKFLTIAFIFAILIRIYFFYISVKYIPTTTDEALAVLIAKSIAKGNFSLLFWGAPYQFPTESYLMAPFVNFLPINAFGARIIPAILGLVSVFGFYFLYKKINRNYTFLLIFFPSAYVISLQSSYFIPEYTFTLTSSWALPYLYLKYLDKGNLKYIVFLGLLAGFSLSTHLLSLPIVLVLSLLVCVSHSFKSAVKNTFLYITSLMIGLVPYLMSLSEAKNTAVAVTGNYPIIIAIERFFSPLISNNLSTLLGYTICPFPDLKQIEGFLPNLTAFFMILFWLILIFVTIFRLFQFILASYKQRWFAFNIYDLFIGTIWASIFAFAFSKRGDFTEFRYLLPVAWFFPFLLSYSLKISVKPLQVILSIYIFVNVIFNFFNSYTLVELWKKKGFSKNKILVPQLDKVLTYLRENNFDKCYASFWDVNRITFEADGKIICSQAYNERFPGWKLPFKEQIDNSEKAAYVLANNKYARLKALDFSKYLKNLEIKVSSRNVGKYVIFDKFKYKEIKNDFVFKEIDFNINENTVYFQSDKILSLRRIIVKSKDWSFINQNIDVFSSKDGKNWRKLKAKIFPNPKGIYIKKFHPIYGKNSSIDLLINSSNNKYYKLVFSKTTKNIIDLFLIMENS